ncbi:putative component of type VI protein secretion system [Klebsiella sp. 1400]|nr:hypothetical protein HMPREF9694_00844 [Klebsiella michiganensis]MDR6617826.1 putative component of type VI protein secretion system [Klebsiella sp. 1400]VUS67618.1 hypothetical protein SB6420_02732 [Klebsiella pasteurii]VUS71612.1 hypothetical protein SPARK1531C2_02499 [Klebsiella grimontii]
MADSFQNEVPKARINLKLALHTGGAQKKVELPLKLLTSVISVMVKRTDHYLTEKKSISTKITSTASLRNSTRK